MMQVKLPRSHWPKGAFRLVQFVSPASLSKLIEEYEKLEDKNPFVSGPLELSDGEILQRLKHVLATTDIYEATAVADTLFDSYESYPQILDAIVLLLPELTKKQKKVAALLIGYLKADSGHNRRPILGKNHHEITEDSAHFLQLKTKAEVVRGRCLSAE